jgi:inosine-uridine nucleoside N-ribohydrolase
MAIFLALRSPEVEVIGLTTIYGNVYTTLATRNALHLVILFVFDGFFVFVFVFY